MIYCNENVVLYMSEQDLHLQSLRKRRKKLTRGFKTVIICIKFRYGVLFSLTLFFSFGFKSYTNIVPKKTSSSVVHESFLFFFESLVSRFTHHSIMSYLKNDQWPHCNNCASTVFSLLFISNLSIFAILLWPIKKKEHNRVVQQANFRCHFIWLPSTEEAQLINNRFSTRSSYSIHHFFCVFIYLFVVFVTTLFMFATFLAGIYLCTRAKLTKINYR